MRSIDQRDVTALVGELHESYGETIAEFSNDHSENILRFCELITNCHKKLYLLDENSASERAIAVIRFIYLAIDNVYLSVKFLSLGYFSQSGNSMRQSLESVCMSILLSYEGEIEIGKNKTIDFFESYKKGDKNTRAHNSLRYVERNIGILGVRRNAVDAMLVGKDHYNDYSHPNMLTFSARMVDVDGGKFFVGGGYDSDKFGAYKKELEDRISFVKTLPAFIGTLLLKLRSA